MENFASLLEEYLSQAEKSYQLGEKVEGTIVHLDENFAYVDIGTKKEARLPLEELKDLEGNLLFKVGDPVKAIIVKRLAEATYLLSLRKILEEEARLELRLAFEKKEPVRIRVGKPVKGGFEALYRGIITGFLPQSQFKEKGEEWEIEVLIQKMDEKGLIFSQRAFLERERKRKLKELIERIEREGLLEGKVKKAVKGGYLVDFEGVLTGYLPFSELTRRRLEAWEGFLKEGDGVRVKVLTWKKDSQKLRLSLKALEPDPWETSSHKYSLDQRVRGRVVKVLNFGAFVELEPGLEGLLPASELSWKKGLKPADILSEGELVEVAITEFNPQERRLILSLKRLEEDPWERLVREFKVGDTISGPIKTITPFGMFVEVLEGVDGFVHISEVSWERLENLEGQFKPGERVEAKIIGLDPEKKRLVLSLRALRPNPWDELSQELRVGEVVEGVIVGVAKNQGYLVRIKEGVVGYLPLKEVSQTEKGTPRVFQEGDSVKGKVILFEPQKRRLWLSEKAYLLEEEKRELEAYQGKEGGTRRRLGRLIKNLKEEEKAP